MVNCGVRMSEMRQVSARKGGGGWIEVGCFSSSRQSSKWDIEWLINYESVTLGVWNGEYNPSSLCVATSRESTGAK